jgi:hypothetical protein
MATPTREIKDFVMSVKVPRSLVFMIDEEADENGLTRGAIVRRHLTHIYRKRAEKGLRKSEQGRSKKGASV